MNNAPAGKVPDYSGNPDFCGLARDKCLAVVALVLLVLVCHPSRADSAASKNILILYSFSDRSVGIPADLLKSALRARVPSAINFDVEYMETRRFDDKEYEKSQVAALRHTYGGEKLDLVIAVSYPALEFAVGHRNELFPGVPIVFSDVDAHRVVEQKIWPGVTGVTEIVDVRGTIDLALRLHPNTNTVAIVTNNSKFDRYWLAVVHGELIRYQGRVREVDLVGLQPGELIEQVVALPPQTVILFQEAPQDSIQPAMGAYDILATIGQRFPTYCIFPVVCLNHGGIGGADLDYKEQASLAADLAERVLSGERPENIPVVLGSADQIHVDWRQLRRWNIPESALPRGSQVLYREPTLWERDRKYILAAIAVIFAQSLWILGLLWQRARKRKAEAVLRESERRFELMADSTALLIWMCDQNGKIIYLNHRRAEFTGLDPKAGYADTWKDYVHPDDLSDTIALFSQALTTPASFSNEYRLRRSDGVYRWMFDVVSPRVNGDGSFAGFVGSAIDVTDQKIAQEALDSVSGQLIEAQERERTRIARDLHDDICQRLALVSMELEQASHNGSSPATKLHLQEIRQHCSEIAGDVQSLSHQLHSSKLDYLGLVAAVRGFSREFAKKHEVSVEFSSHDVPARLPKDISLCLFRVAQEALQNAMKYSGATQFFVELSTATNELRLDVRDGGVGFDVDEAKRNGGLGLVSMQERVHLVHGRFSVESAPGKGARIIAVVPLATEIAEDFADGTDSEATGITGAA